MVYDRHIDKTEEELCKLNEVCSRNEVDRFIDGLESGRINTEEKVIEFTNFIRISDGLTQLEYSRLKRLLDRNHTAASPPSSVCSQWATPPWQSPVVKKAAKQIGFHDLPMARRLGFSGRRKRNRSQ